MSNPSVASLDKLVCPACRAELLPSPARLTCSRCHQGYPLRDGIPDFLDEVRRSQRVGSWIRLPEKIRQSHSAWLAEHGGALTDLAVRIWWELFAKIYESRICIQRALQELSLGQLQAEAIYDRMLAKVRREGGLILDAASGPGTLGRRLAGPQGIFAVDLLLPMLHRGAAHAAAEKVLNIQFVSARVESLPFLDSAFDGAILGQALHWMPDAAVALSELARVLRQRAPLSGSTVLKGGRSRPACTCADNGGHPFEIDELRALLQRAGFDRIEIESIGELILFSAQRA